MTIQISDLGLCNYAETYKKMYDFNEQRNAATPDQIWLLEHPPVYTLGLSGKTEHLLNTHDIPVVETDRGGQVTYHGPGQLIAYLLIDLKRRPYAIKKLVTLIEQALLDYLQSLAVNAQRKAGAPGVYIEDKKIAALGIRVRKGGTYHGLSLNVDMDLTPFAGINPCGYAGMECTQLSDFINGITLQQVKHDFPEYLIKHLEHRNSIYSDVA